MLCSPKPNGFADHYPVFKWLAIIGKINPTFSDIPTIWGDKIRDRSAFRLLVRQWTLRGSGRQRRITT